MGTFLLSTTISTALPAFPTFLLNGRNIPLLVSSQGLHRFSRPHPFSHSHRPYFARYSLELHNFNLCSLTGSFIAACIHVVVNFSFTILSLDITSHYDIVQQTSWKNLCTCAASPSLLPIHFLIQPNLYSAPVTLPKPILFKSAMFFQNPDGPF